uniref:NADH:flavin oxidoreductase/NADH oxidase N-terminal domain-containing protein n=1 Tax=Globisporangium ultimum (strain ATCC 200006 / CBS 805.95 / DAOM BR144) TaxID=431595 RepID=K3WA77_GLOUD
MAIAKLFTPLTLRGQTNPLRLAPGIPPAITATYYDQRATPGGLLVSEVTNISPMARGYFGAPGIFNDEQTEGWSHVTKTVRTKGGKIFLQLWYTGRCNHPLNQPQGELPVSSSATSLDGVKSAAVAREGKQAYVTPRALETDEIVSIIEGYRKAAVNALDAGFDGTELHAGNGYLLEQFLCDSVSERSDEYGDSVENRVGPSRVTLRLSPFGTTFGCTDSDPERLYGHAVKKLNTYDLAYLHLIEPRGVLVPADGVTALLRLLYDGTVISASGYDRASVIEAVERGTTDAVAFGRALIANPDLLARLQQGADLNHPKVKSYYLGGEEGYTDYPFFPSKRS